MPEKVIVVGAGLSGLSAAHTIYLAGGNVTLLDKNSFMGGNSTKATSGINGALTRTQVDLNIGDSVKQFYDDTLKSARDKARPDLIKVLTYKSAAAVEWLMDEFNLDLTLVSRLGGHSQPRTHRGHDAKFPGMAITYALMERWEQLCEKEPERAKLVKKARVVEIIKEGNEATGVVYEFEGKKTTINGPVVLATGGYAADFTDNSLLKKHRPDVYDLATTNGQHATGDGQKMLMAIGANGVDMDKVQVHPTGLIDPKDPGSKWKFLAAEALRGEGGILINNKGQRFCDDLGHRDYVSGMIFKEKEKGTPSSRWMNSVRRLHTTAEVSRKWIRIHWWPKYERWQDLEKDTIFKKKGDEAVKQMHRFSDEFYIHPERREDALPKKQFEDQSRRDQNAPSLKLLTDHTTLRYVDHSYDNIRRVRRYEAFQLRQYDQRFIAERLLFLGADLAAAHFLVHRKAAVKFIGDNNWYKKDRWGRYSLPGRQIPGLYVEAIDASGTELMYEGFDNLYDLKHLRMLRLANCEFIDDWALSRVGGVCGSTLEFLDLSGCKNITHKGLAALRTAKNLKYLRLEGLDHIPHLGKTVLMLEEMIPGLIVTGLNFDKELERLEWENKLKEDDRAVIDAKGNVFVEDDNGELYYIHGKISEKATVNDDDQPIVTSTIRKQVPEMSEVEFERLDQLSKGRLRHLMVGSPSGYMWSDQVERILQHENKLHIKDGIETDPKLLPKEQRRKRLLAMGVDMELLLEEDKKTLRRSDAIEKEQKQVEAN